MVKEFNTQGKCENARSLVRSQYLLILFQCVFL